MEGVTGARGCGTGAQRQSPRRVLPGSAAGATRSTRTPRTSALRVHRLIAACATYSCGLPSASVTSAYCARKAGAGGAGGCSGGGAGDSQLSCRQAYTCQAAVCGLRSSDIVRAAMLSTAAVQHRYLTSQAPGRARRMNVGSCAVPCMHCVLVAVQTRTRATCLHSTSRVHSTGCSSVQAAPQCEHARLPAPHCCLHSSADLPKVCTQNRTSDP